MSEITKDDLINAIKASIPEYEPIAGYVCPGKHIKDMLCSLVEAYFDKWGPEARRILRVSCYLENTSTAVSKLLEEIRDFDFGKEGGGE